MQVPRFLLATSLQDNHENDFILCTDPPMLAVVLEFETQQAALNFIDELSEGAVMDNYPIVITAVEWYQRPEANNQAEANAIAKIYTAMAEWYEGELEAENEIENELN